MKKAFWAVLLYFFSNIANAFDSTPSVFYPLPTENQGRQFAAKQLFLAPGGGLWIHDVRDKVLFFDGRTVSPKQGSVLPYRTDKFQFQANSFWTYQGNLVYRSVSHLQREVVFSLPPGSEINQIGSNKDYIWVTDDSSFYAYQISTGELETHSLMALYQFNDSTHMQVNDALKAKKKWILATKSGVYLLEKDGFSHVARSKNRDISQLYFSESRRELLVGTATGAVVYDLYDTSGPKFIVPSPGITAFAETKQAYWIGTENGLYVYSFLSGAITKYSGKKDAGYSLVGQKINAIVNDNVGGMWIATNKGIQYYSLFGDKFERFPTNEFNDSLIKDDRHGRLRNLVAMKQTPGYWVISERSLSRIISGEESVKQPIYSGLVGDIAEIDGRLWVTTSQGMKVFDSVTGKPLDELKLPRVLQELGTGHLAPGHDGILWGSSDGQLWRYDINSRAVTEYRDSWMAANLPASTITSMVVSSNDHLLIGTEHGIYMLREGQIYFVAQSAEFGAVLSIEEGREDQVWVASNYGVNILDINTTYFQPIRLIDEHIGPQCLLRNDAGMWLTSSSGLTHYSMIGQFVSHYSQPFGVINNEFHNSFCLPDAKDPQSLLLGSWLSLVRVNSEDLVVSPLPEAKVIFSQIRINQNLVSFGSIAHPEIVAPYGDSISVQIGMLPHINGSILEYRLNDETHWTQLDGYQILMEGLAPGSYELYVRPVVNGIERGRSKSIAFSITEPWYLTAAAISGYVIFAIILLSIIIFWRSRVMSKSNRELKAQVALKTNQLRHQSRILLSNNHQLRKQLQVRRIIFTQAIQSFRERLAHAKSFYSGQEESQQGRIIERISSELELLINVRESQSEELAAYNLSLIFLSILDGWRDDFAKAGISIEIDTGDQQGKYVLLEYFNLDVLFNLLMDGLVKRCFRHQVVHVVIQYSEECVTLSMLDHGLVIDQEKDSAWPEIISLVETSGGKLSLESADGQNVVTLTWQSSQGFDENSVLEFSNMAAMLNGNDANNGADPWIEKLEELVRVHFSDADFSTSTAAKLMFVSERSLQRRFKSATQRTFTDYLSEVRLDNACRRLLAGEKVSEVAFASGFNDPSYFSQRFKHRFGVSPTQFVEEKDPHTEVGSGI
ncbi:AraC/XylS family transcriptional regulator [Vibrio ichthyoenteri ATCC 700023]|uniref:AraC/XylS family transcriptional regulator n=1 Tax=Vibrio ichthyoenteri ATCC 700023 TaxID=870968 RepID=F9RXX2_9VIBR|nr:AraC family transcriptional regulator [Vibrio ichthyoenteri]EGU47236.1 AraC/XylS family transcriptional regulator [Vibrio ichthyoenteri ATCC 700023]